MAWSMERASWYYFSIALCINLVGLAVSSIRYKMLLKYMGERLNLINSLSVMAVAQFANFIFPFRTGNIVIRPIATKYFGNISVRKSFGVTIFEVGFDILWQAILLGVILAVTVERLTIAIFNPWILVPAILLVLGIIIISKWRRIIIRLWRSESFLGRRIRNLGKQLGFREEEIQGYIDNAIRYMKNYWLVSYLLVFTLIIIFLQPLLITYSCAAFSVWFSYPVSFTILWVSFIVGRLSGIPGGLGASDLSVGGLLIGYGVEPVTSLKIVVLYRIVVMLPYFLLGSPLFLYLMKGMAVQGISRWRNVWRASSLKEK